MVIAAGRQRELSCSLFTLVEPLGDAGTLSALLSLGYEHFPFSQCLPHSCWDLCTGSELSDSVLSELPCG